ncbi:MAG: nucleoside-diphosphate kinase [Bacteroidota bacterium]|nr:nucleoside-diphosphate kinase [Bacteroidota bacterium]
MNGEITFTIVKPSSISRNHLGPILTQITENGFKIIAIKMLHLSTYQASAFYSVHKGKFFFDDLIEYMTSGPVVVAMLEKDNAVDDFRKLIGATNPEKADNGTIRKLYGIDMQRNAVHGSDSDENALIECRFFFSDLEIFAD